MNKQWIQVSLKEWHYVTLREESHEIHGRVIEEYDSHGLDVDYVATVNNPWDDDSDFSVSFQLKAHHENIREAKEDVEVVVRVMDVEIQHLTKALYKLSDKISTERKLD